MATKMHETCDVCSDPGEVVLRVSKGELLGKCLFRFTLCKFHSEVLVTDKLSKSRKEKNERLYRLKLNEKGSG